VILLPSVLAADFGHLADEVARAERGGAGAIHADVMDGHFVPNLSLGLPVIESIRRVCGLRFDCHLMMTNAHAYFEALAAAGGDLVTVHVEVYPDPTRTARIARDAGLAFGLVVNPPTPFAAVEPFVELCDVILVMSVNPGFGGQSFIPEVLAKVEAARKTVDSMGLATDIQIDGGITPATAPRARSAGANVFVAGSAIFRQPDPVEAVRALRRAVESVNDTDP
jgi:ribulose-phosphate 3-epimerase